jgi:hypothetical protein
LSPTLNATTNDHALLERNIDMMTWSLTIDCSMKPRTIVGQAESRPAALDCLTRAARQAITDADTATRPRYLMHIDGKLTALMATGTTDCGQPDHSAVADLLDRLGTSPTPEAGHATAPPEAPWSP